MVAEFKPKDAEVLKAEITAELGMEYEGNEETVDKLVARGLKDEEFKASLHSQKKSLQDKEAKRIEAMKLAGLDPETGAKIEKENKKVLSLKEQVKEGKALSDLEDDENMDEVIDYAERKGVTLTEARKSPFIKVYLKTKAEERASALAASTESKRGTKQEGGETILENFNKGIISEKDEDIEKLVAQQIAAKKASAGLNK